jgi:hypothetical protein
MQNVYDAAVHVVQLHCYCWKRLWSTVFTVPAAGHRLKTGVASFVIEKSCVFCRSCEYTGCRLHCGCHRLHLFIFCKSVVTHDCFAFLSTFISVPYCLGIVCTHLKVQQGNNQQCKEKHLNFYISRLYDSHWTFLWTGSLSKGCWLLWLLFCFV